MGKIIAVIIILAIGGLVFSFTKNNQKATLPTEMPKTTRNSPERFTPPTTPPPSRAVVNVPVKEITLKANIGFLSHRKSV